MDCSIWHRGRHFFNPLKVSKGGCSTRFCSSEVGEIVSKFNSLGGCHLIICF